MAESSWRLGVPVTMTEMLAQDRYHTDSGAIQFYCVAEVPDVYGRQALFVYPAAVADETLDYVYVRRPRELRYSGHDAAEYTGTITLTAGSDVVLGTGTQFSSEMVGSILRVGTDANRPTGRFGEHPFAEERSVASVESATQLTLDAGAAATRSGVGYAITDVIDLGRVAHTAFLRLAEMHVAIGRNLKSLGAIRELADRALLEAMAADNPVAYDPASDASYPIVTLPQGEVRF
jgi:hypothetical protein